jgi:hypothetical protein
VDLAAKSVPIQAFSHLIDVKIRLLTKIGKFSDIVKIFNKILFYYFMKENNIFDEKNFFKSYIFR